MANGPLVDYESVIRKTLDAAARLFLEQGYSATNIREIADKAGVGKSAMLRAFKSKERILCELVKYVLKGQFSAAKGMLQGKEYDPVMYYVVETVLQLYMAESDEAIRDLYGAAYSMPETSELIHRAVSENLLSVVFKEYLPTYTTEDFYYLEIASGGVIRGYMTVPCSETFPMEKKVRSFLEASLRIYKVPEEKIKETLAFIQQFDFTLAADQTIRRLLKRLNEGAG